MPHSAAKKSNTCSGYCRYSHAKWTHLDLKATRVHSVVGLLEGISEIVDRESFTWSVMEAWQRVNRLEEGLEVSSMKLEIVGVSQMVMCALLEVLEVVLENSLDFLVRSQKREISSVLSN